MSLSHLSQFLSWSIWLLNQIGNLATTDEGGNDGSTDNEGEDKSVDSVPSWGPAGSSGADISIVEEGKGEELGDEADFSTQEEGGPSDGCCNNTNGITWVALFTTEAGPFKTPMDSAEEGDDLEFCQNLWLCLRKGLTVAP